MTKSNKMRLKMTILERTKNIIKAQLDLTNQNSADSAEELNKALNTMRVLITDFEKSAAASLSEIKLIKRQIEVMEGEQATWLDNAEKAVGAGQDDLARRALIQKKSVSEEIKRCHELLGKTDENYRYYLRELTKGREKYNDFKTKLTLLQHNNLLKKAGMALHSEESINGVDLEAQFNHLRNKSSRNEEVEEEFLNLKKKIKQSN